ncbi:hypothetical protein DXG03_002401 [Asterophora parasitica]|uniref:Uncharacterized protein n=1 Tax=Asterophora parasitica TaxID=117018 RepID=A0A9P7GA44_9AGAR|nr:hypothetical protein DXG03_002401 [Asterophora parasitica]
MQITAGMTLGLLAWDKRDGSTAAKRYQEALDLAATHAPFVSPSLAPGTVGLGNDERNAELGAEAKSGKLPARKDVAELPLPQARIDKAGNVTAEETTKFATTPCTKCGKRGTRLRRCSEAHKKTCKKSPSSQ